MNLKTTKLRDAITFALVAGTTSLVGTGVAVAQDSEQATTLDRIQVTGSRIRSVDTETAQPIVTITREDIQTQGAQSVGDILATLTAAGSPTLSRSSPLSAGESPGGTYIDLRNLGPERTLVLVNGKRLGINADGLQDIATIPTSVVERIDVLKDGASALYGSDAIAGVINIITRSNFEGVEVNAAFGQYGEGDGQQQSFDFTIGTLSDRGSVMLSAQYAKEDPVWARDRFWAIDSAPGFPERSITSVGAIGSVGIGGVWNVLREGGDYRNPADYRPQDTGYGGDVSNPSEQMMAYTGMERTSLFAAADYQLTDLIRFRTDVLYNKRETDVQVAGYPFQSSSFDSVNNPEVADVRISPDSYFNPFGEAVDYRRRGWEVPRTTQRTLDTYRWTAAFEGSFQTGERYWDWDIGTVYNRNDGNARARGDFNLLSVANAVGPSFMNEDGVIQCGTPDRPLPLGVGQGGCTPWNPLLSAGPNSLADPDVQQYLFHVENARSKATMHNYFANIAGTIATLPAGELGIAAGYEYRREEAEYNPDGFAQSGNSTNLAAGPTSGEYSVDEVYLEIEVPLLADLPGAQELSVNLASRYSDYSTFGDTTNSKASFRWRPIDDLMVRGTWAQGFRAPAISDLYGGEMQTFTRYTDPCDSLFGNATVNPATAARCAADIPNADQFRQIAQGGEPADGGNSQPNTPFRTGSNQFLVPETSISRSLGLVYSPNYVTGLGLSLDWWRVRIDNTIVSDTPTAILEDCYINDIASRCDLFQRDDYGTVVDLGFGGRNAGYVTTEGFDVGVNYRFDTVAVGTFAIDWQTTYVSEYEMKADDAAETIPSPYTSFGGYFRLRSNLSLNWDFGDFGATWTTRYHSAIKEGCETSGGVPAEGFPCSDPTYQAPDTGGVYPLNRVGSTTFNDVQVRWRAPWNATVSVGVDNVFDRTGPVLFSAPNSGFAYYGGFDIGRFPYLRYQQRF